MGGCSTGFPEEQAPGVIKVGQCCVRHGRGPKQKHHMSAILNQSQPLQARLQAAPTSGSDDWEVQG